MAQTKKKKLKLRKVQPSLMTRAKYAPTTESGRTRQKQKKAIKKARMEFRVRESERVKRLPKSTFLHPQKPGGFDPEGKVVKGGVKKCKVGQVYDVKIGRCVSSGKR